MEEKIIRWSVEITAKEARSKKESCLFSSEFTPGLTKSETGFSTTLKVGEKFTTSPSFSRLFYPAGRQCWQRHRRLVSSGHFHSQMFASPRRSNAFCAFWLFPLLKKLSLVLTRRKKKLLVNFLALKSFGKSAVFVGVINLRPKTRQEGNFMVQFPHANANRELEKIKVDTTKF